MRFGQSRTGVGACIHTRWAVQSTKREGARALGYRELGGIERVSNVLGPYVIQGELGRGAMAVVWRAIDTNLGREVAIKEPLMPSNASDWTAREFAERFVREGRAAAALSHPGIVTFYSADIVDGRPILVMELVEGETLAAVLERGALPAATVVGILDQLLDAVDYAHSRGIVHRDIKPDNVFVTRSGCVKLADFGIAHIGSATRMTQIGSVVGTPGYMAPEQVMGDQVDARTDVFAVGVLAYEMLAGFNPFGTTDGTDPTAVMYRIVHTPTPQLYVGNPPSPNVDLSAVVSTAMAKNPADRFVDARSFRSALMGGPMPRATQVVGPSPPAYPAQTASPGLGAASFESGSTHKQSTAPYLAVGGVALALVAILLLSAGGTSGGGGVATPSAATVSGGDAGAVAPSSPDPEAAAADPAPIVDSEPAPSKPTPRDITLLATINASSSLPNTTKYTYDPSNIADGDPETCWSEGIDPTGEDYGIDEWVDFDFGQVVYISDIEVLPGYDKDGSDWDRWLTNGRLREAEFVFSGGEYAQFEFADARSMQGVGLGEPVAATSVRVYIRSVYEAEPDGTHPGSADTSISEMRISGWTESEAE